MKAKIKETGEIVEVYHEPQHGTSKMIYKESVLVNARIWTEDELDLLNENNDDNIGKMFVKEQQLPLCKDYLLLQVGQVVLEIMPKLQLNSQILLLNNLKRNNYGLRKEIQRGS